MIYAICGPSADITTSCLVQEQMKQPSFTCGPQLHLHWLLCCGDCRGACLAVAARAQPDTPIRSSTRFNRIYQPASAGCCSHLQTSRLVICSRSISNQSRQPYRCDQLSCPRLRLLTGWNGSARMPPFFAAWSDMDTDITTPFLQCMKHSVHCEQTSDVNSLLDQHFPLGRTLAQPRSSPAGLCPAMDWSTHTFVQRRLLAQKLLERSHASKALMEALDGPAPNRDAALVILLHCCKLNNTLSQSCIKAGLIRRLFHLAHSPDMTPVAKVRCSYQGIDPPILHVRADILHNTEYFVLQRQ